MSSLTAVPNRHHFHLSRQTWRSLLGRRNLRLQLFCALVPIFLVAVPAHSASSEETSQPAVFSQMRLVLETELINARPTRTAVPLCGSLERLLAEPQRVVQKLTGRKIAEPFESVSLYRLGSVQNKEIIEIRYFAKEHPEYSESKSYLDLRLTLIGNQEYGYCTIIAVEQTMAKMFFRHRAKPTSRLVVTGAGLPFDHAFVDSRVPMSGTSHYRHHHVFRIVEGRPVEIDLVEQASELTKTLMPQGASNWKGSNFDLGLLQWRSGLWRHGDANCCPSGGTLFVQFRLNGDHLEVMEHEIFHSWAAMVDKHGAHEDLF